MASQISICPISEDPTASYHLIFYITGNPGMISYYDAFLKTLHQLVTESSTLESEVVHVFGQSLDGFGDNDAPLEATGRPHTLEDQIVSRLQILSERRIPSGPRHGQYYDSIILMGHSVGTYILLEMLQRLRKDGSSLNITGGILLMPTIMGLALSPSGVKASPLLRLPGLPRALHLLAKTIFWSLSTAALEWLVGKVMGMPDDAAVVTTRFLKSDMGIWQALQMASDEMNTITIDKWDDEIWGVEKEAEETTTNLPKLFFYWAEKDHWVANHTRDSLIAARGKLAGDTYSTKPEMVIDKNGISHAFCIAQSESMAEKVAPWIEEIISVSRR